MTEFAHLHLHTQYSLLDGAIRTKDLPEIVRKRGMSAVAVTDHGHLLGHLDAYGKLREAGVNPILGCETYVCSNHREKGHRRNYHLILLAENETGYNNLRQLNSRAHLDGFHYHPRVDHDLLRKHADGIVALSACLGGECAQALLVGGHDAARDKIKEYRDIFGAKNFYLEVQPNGIADQDSVNEAWRALGPELGVGLVATADCHYPDVSDASAHETLLAIQQNRDLTDERRLSHGKNAAYYVRTPEQMNQVLGGFAWAMDNAGAIAARCNVQLKLDKIMLPKFPLAEPVDEWESEATRLADLSIAGLEERFTKIRARGQAFDKDQYKARLSEELGMIEKMGFCGYFLIVWDFIRYAHDNGIPVGPGRGSGAGSLVAWALRITDVDPIELGLYFERFLNPERVSMPDFDVDFCFRRRSEVVRYVVQKYGRDRVAQIATFTSLQAKSAVDAVGKVRGLSIGETKAITASIPDLVDGHPATIAWASKNAESVIAALKDPITEPVVREAERLEGLFKTTSVHAAGIVIAPSPLWDHVAVMKSRHEDGELDCAQAGMEQVEKLGLVKFDFLGLKNLTTIDLAAQEISRRQGTLFDLAGIPLDDSDTYAMISAGDTDGVFQLVEDGMKGLLRRLKPDRFADIVAVVSLYRPGPLEGGMVDDFVARKHGRARVESLHPALDDILAETYGVIVYQEQVMQIARALAGYSLGGADLLRRAMGKKKKEVMDKERAKFLAGCAVVGICGPDLAVRIFDLMATFAGYGFNKSHASAYALITYQTAYLKRRYPVEYLAALASTDQGAPEKYVPSLRAARVQILPPCVQRSALDCTVEGSAVRLGLLSVVGVGEAAARVLRAAQPFADLADLFRRVDLGTCNKRAMDALVGAGAFDALHPDRAALSAGLDGLIAFGNGEQKARRGGQTSLFDLLGAGAAAASAPSLPAAPPWTPAALLKRERTALGFYLSGHPSRAALELRFVLGARTVSEALRMAPGSRVCVLGILGDVAIKGKTPEKQVVLSDVEDETGKMGTIVFKGRRPQWDRTYQSATHPDDPETRYVLCRGELQADRVQDGIVRLAIAEIEPLRAEYARAVESLRRAKAVRLILDADGADLRADLIAIKAAAAAAPGDLPLVLQLHGAGRDGGDLRAVLNEVHVQATVPLVAAMSRLRHALGMELTP